MPPTYSSNRTNDPNACMGCGRFEKTIARAITTKGFAVNLCSGCREHARSHGRLRNDDEHDANLQAVRSAPEGHIVTLQGDGITLHRIADDGPQPVTIEEVGR
jgi:hypothetical protein